MTTRHIQHPVPILTHAASRRHHKRRRYEFVLTPLNVTIFVVLAMVAGMLIGSAIYKANAGTLANYVCDAFTHLSVC